MAGVSRSSSIVLAWMLIYRASIEASQHNEEKKVNKALEANIAKALDGMTSLGDFLLYAQKVRPQVFPNAEFLRQLLEFEVELFGEKRTDTESLPGPSKCCLFMHLKHREQNVESGVQGTRDLYRKYLSTEVMRLASGNGNGRSGH